MSVDIRAYDRRALEATGRVVAAVTADQLDAPTPCADWDLRSLLVHMAGNNNGFADAAEGKPTDPAVWTGVGLDAEPVGAYRESAERVETAFSADGVLDRTLEVHGFGRFPAYVAIEMHFVDYLVHGWDVARAIGMAYRLDPELSLTVLSIGARWPAGSPRTWGPGAPFAYQVPVSDGAPPDHRLLGFLGRSPDWTPAHV